MDENTETIEEQPEDNLPSNPQDFIPPAVVSIIENELSSNKDKFYAYLLFTPTIRDAARLAGISDVYGYKLNRTGSINSKILDKLGEVGKRIKQQYILTNQMALPKVLQAKMNALEYGIDNPEALLKNPKIAESFERVAQVIESDQAPQQVVNVDKMQVIIQNALGLNDIQGSKSGQKRLSD